MAEHVSHQRKAAERRAFYDDHSYLVVADLLTQGEVARLQAALAELREQTEGVTESNQRFFVVRGDDGHPSVSRVRNPSPTTTHSASWSRTRNYSTWSRR